MIISTDSSLKLISFAMASYYRTELAVAKKAQQHQAVQMHDSFFRETQGLREALKVCQTERDTMIAQNKKYWIELKELRATTAKDADIKREKDELNDTLAQGLNHSKMLNQEAETIYQDKLRLQNELADAQQKISMLLVKTDGKFTLTKPM